MNKARRMRIGSRRDGFVVETTIVLKLRGVGKNVQTVNSLSVSHHITVLVISFVLFS